MELYAKNDKQGFFASENLDSLFVVLCTLNLLIGPWSANYSSPALLRDNLLYGRDTLIIYPKTGTRLRRLVEVKLTIGDPMITL